MSTFQLHFSVTVTVYFLQPRVNIRNIFFSWNYAIHWMLPSEVEMVFD